jgi:hypothetical protein
LGDTTVTAVWEANTFVLVITEVVLVQVRLIFPTPDTVSTSVPLGPVDTEALPTVSPAVKLTGGPEAVSTVSEAGVPTCVPGSVRTVDWLAGLASVAVTVVVYVPETVRVRKSVVVSGMRMSPEFVSVNDLPAVTDIGTVPVVTVSRNVSFVPLCVVHDSV